MSIDWNKDCPKREKQWLEVTSESGQQITIAVDKIVSIRKIASDYLSVPAKQTEICTENHTYYITMPYEVVLATVGAQRPSPLTPEDAEELLKYFTKEDKNDR